MNSYFYKAIDKVVSATSSKELCNALRQCQDVLASGFISRANFMEQLQWSISKQAAYYKYNASEVNILEKPWSNVFIHKDKIAYLVYSSFLINLCTDFEEMDEQISGIIDFFENKMSRPKSDILNTSEIIDMLNIVQEKYGLVDVITNGKDLEIFVVNKSHVCYDSFLLSFLRIFFLQQPLIIPGIRITTPIRK